MYHRVDEKEFTLQKTVKVDGLTVEIDVTNVDKRLSTTIDGKFIFSNNIQNFLDQLPDDIRKGKAKTTIYKAAGQLFERIEQQYPDSSQGVLPFLMGADYRIPTQDNIYCFDFAYESRAGKSGFWDINSSLELDYHMKNSDPETWPIYLKLKQKNREITEELTLYFDPYKMIDLFFDLIDGGEHEYEYISLDKKVVHYTFISFPQYNLVKIETEAGLIKKSYDELLKNCVLVLNDLFFDLMTVRGSIQETIKTSYLLRYWDDLGIQSRERLGEEKRIIEGIKSTGKLFDPQTLPLPISWCIAADVTSAIKKHDLETILCENHQRERRKQYEQLRKKVAEYLSDDHLTDERLLKLFKENTWIFYEALYGPLDD